MKTAASRKGLNKRVSKRKQRGGTEITRNIFTFASFPTYARAYALTSQPFHTVRRKKPLKVDKFQLRALARSLACHHADLSRGVHDSSETCRQRIPTANKEVGRSRFPRDLTGA